jgi:hypothetical protein
MQSRRRARATPARQIQLKQPCPLLPSRPQVLTHAAHQRYPEGRWGRGSGSASHEIYLS